MPGAAAVCWEPPGSRSYLCCGEGSESPSDPQPQGLILPSHGDETHTQAPPFAALTVSSPCLQNTLVPATTQGARMGARPGSRVAEPGYGWVQLPGGWPAEGCLAAKGSALGPQRCGQSWDSRSLQTGCWLGAGDPTDTLLHRSALSSASQVLMVPEPDPWGQSQQENPAQSPSACSPPAHEPDPHQEPQGAQGLQPLSGTQPLSPHTPPRPCLPSGAAQPWDGSPWFFTPQVLQTPLASRHHGRGQPGTGLVPGQLRAAPGARMDSPHPPGTAPQGAADSGSQPAPARQHKPRHWTVFSCFSQSADACGNRSGEGESKQGQGVRGKQMAERRQRRSVSWEDGRLGAAQ